MDYSLYDSKPYALNKNSFTKFPFVYLELDSLEVAHKILVRSVMIKCFILVLSQTVDYEEMENNLDREKVKEIKNEVNEFTRFNGY